MFTVYIQNTFQISLSTFKIRSKFHLENSEKVFFFVFLFSPIQVLVVYEELLPIPGSSNLRSLRLSVLQLDSGPLYTFKFSRAFVYTGSQEWMLNTFQVFFHSV